MWYPCYRVMWWFGFVLMVGSAVISWAFPHHSYWLIGWLAGSIIGFASIELNYKKRRRELDAIYEEGTE